MSKDITLDKVASLAKRRGFVFQTSEIYGGLASSYEYGPLGVELLRNIKNLWWKEFVHKRSDMVGLDSQIILHPETWVASGHVDSFTDPLVEDLVTHKRFRADHLIESWVESNPQEEGFSVEEFSVSQMAEFISENNILSPDGNEVSEPKDFKLLFETAIGSVSGEKSVAYLRGETAQGIFSNFKQVLDSTRVKLPFGIAQLGKAFRNEITTGQFVFRTLEFEQAEIEYFFNPDVDDWKTVFEDWKQKMWNFVTKNLEVSKENLRWRQHTDTERSFYSKDTYDLDYKFPFGFKELWGIAYRTNYDLKQHSEHSGQSLEYTDPYTKEKFLPHVVEPAAGINRLFLMVLTESYWEDEKNNRTVLKLPFSIAPYKVAVFPLLANKAALSNKARDVFNSLVSKFHVNWDDRGNIGKRYKYQDEMGTPFCVTIDFDTLEDDAVTVRHRDTAEQERISIDSLEEYLDNQLNK